ncbi:TetR/AcrR family transcriptional regulator [Oerskovia sp. NPDC060338]|uniref:TetR/AcrR family transcriptional regulator n=1 Tax=Oerskovia sp. NPDC060338 TaxID=3347100 RepID=UPI0036657826
MIATAAANELRTTPPTGRRQRAMREKEKRIFEAASTLFDQRDFQHVVTQEISKRADVAVGTLFRYAASKGELLLMVYNEHLREAVAAGERASAGIDDPADAVVALVAPILVESSKHAQNAAAYQRELLFGSPEEKYRIEGLALVEGLEARIAERLVAAASPAPGAPGTGPGPAVEVPDAVGQDASRAARSVFAVLHLLLAQASTGAHASRDASVELDAQVRQIVRGFLATVAPAPTP